MANSVKLFFLEHSLYFRKYCLGVDYLRGLAQRGETIPMSYFPLVDKSAINRELLYYVVGGQHNRDNQHLVRQICDLGNFTAEDFKHRDGSFSIFIEAAYAGNVRIFQYLQKRYGLTREDALADRLAAVRSTGALGHTKMFKYLDKEFALTPHELEPGCYYAQCNGRNEIVDYCRSRGVLNPHDWTNPH